MSIHKKTLFKYLIPFSLVAFITLYTIYIPFVNAGNSAYSITEYQCVALATIDGNWTTADEWNDGPVIEMSNNASFTYNVDMTSYSMQWLIEFFTDNTNDTEDYCQICLDADNSGGFAPQVGDYKIEIQGHTTLKIYQGNGTSWVETSPISGEMTWANTISNSTWNNATHWILEISDSSKIADTIQTPVPPNGMRVAVYDATTGELVSWAPNSNADVPNEWGVISTYSTTPIPTPTPIPTATPQPTATPSSTPTASTTPTPTATPTPSPAPTATPSPSISPSPSTTSTVSTQPTDLSTDESTSPKQSGSFTIIILAGVVITAILIVIAALIIHRKYAFDQVIKTIKTV